MREALTLRVPGEVLEAVRLPPGEIEEELRRELALALYRRGVLSLGKARLLAQMTKWQFEEFLGQRQIPRHYTEEDLEEDIRYAHSHQ
jgi:predicted HTH domain antitoxin